MIKMETHCFKSGLLWYACADIPSDDEKFTLWFDDKVHTFFKAPITIHAVGLTRSKATERLESKITKHFSD